jgi:hypothetical protein
MFKPPPREWRRNKTDDHEFIISTDPERLDHDFINNAFDTEEMYWAKRLPHETLSLMLSQSITLGIYEITPHLPPPSTSSSPSSPRTPSPTLEASSTNANSNWKQVGMARFITDYVSTCYLTDVYVLPSHRNYKLGKWVVTCCKEVIDTMPALRRAFLVASQGMGKQFYARELGMWDVEEEKEHLAIMTVKTFKAAGEH